MSLKYAHSSTRFLTRAACVATIVGLSAFGIVASAGAATTHFGPIPGSPVAVGQTPVAAAFDTNVNPATGHQQVYIANSGSNSVSVIDASTHLVTNTIGFAHIGGTPSAITINQTDDLVFVAQYDDESVTIIDGRTNSVIGAGHVVGPMPDALAWDSVNHRVYVANYGNGTVTILDDKTGVEVPLGTVSIGTGGSTSKPEGIAVDQLTNKIVIAAQGDDKVFIMNGNSNALSTATATFASPNAVTVDAVRGWAYVANYDNNTVSVVDLATGADVPGSPITVGNNPNALAINENTGQVYVANFNSSLSIIDPSDLSVTTTGAVGNKPSGVAVDSGPSGEVYVTNQADGAVTILGTTVSPTITSGAPPVATEGASYSFPFSATGTPSQITFSVTGNLPTGLSLVDGTLVGTPTESGTFAFTLHASNGADPEATADYTLTVNAAATTTTTPPPSVAGAHLPVVSG
jgi:YVTN family beta-propeller protein